MAVRPGRKSTVILERILSYTLPGASEIHRSFIPQQKRVYSIKLIMEGKRGKKLDNMPSMKNVIISGILSFVLFGSFVFANGGNIRLAEGRYLVNISSSPVTPVAGEKVEMLVSFASIEDNTLLREDLRTWVEIRRKVNDEVIFPEKEFRAERGVLDFDFTYPESGLYELFVRFEKPDEPGKIYETEDFLVDVQSQRIQSRGTTLFPMYLVVSSLVSLLAGWFLGRRSGRRRAG